MREIVIVIRDLYLQPGESPGASVPGIGHLARFGDETALPEGWRVWTARWLGLSQYADAAPASIAAAALADALSDRAVWLATPVHLIAGLTSLHFDRRSMLRLREEDLGELAASFGATFRDSGFELRPLAGGELLLLGQQVSPPATTTEPARMLLTSVAESLPTGEGARALRRLSAEIEMWLHGHPINDQLARRGALTAATLWLWGGGNLSAPRPVATPKAITDAAFGCDAYVHGLWRLAGGETRPMPVDWASVIGEPRAERALAVVEVAELLQANASWSLADAVAEIDRRVISPSIAALRRDGLDRLTLLANDRCLSLRAADHWRLWRRMRAHKGLEALT
ncbi:MAG TPA: hypothetical protein VIY50_10525 [Steroidobacteraceae bacterium]